MKRIISIFLLLAVVLFNEIMLPLDTWAESDNLSNNYFTFTDVLSSDIDKNNIYVATPSISTDMKNVEKYKKLAKILNTSAPYDIILFYKHLDVDVDDLKQATKPVQARTVEILEDAKNNNQVVDYKAFYIINAINAKITDAEILKEIVNLDEVEDIEINEEITIAPIEDKSLKRQKRALQDSSKYIFDDEFGILKFDDKFNKNATWAVERTGANLVWKDYNITGKNITVAILDTGVNYKLDELKYAYKGYDKVSDTFDETYYKDFTGTNHSLDSNTNKHGTTVASTLFGRKIKNKFLIKDSAENADIENNIYYYGTAPNVKFINAKVIDGERGNIASIVQASEWILEKKPDVINNSWGDTENKAISRRLQEVIKSWKQAGIIVVMAAGNAAKYSKNLDGGISYPANQPGIFSVGAVDNNNIIWEKSLRGPSPYTNDIKPDIVAPGVMVDILYSGNNNSAIEAKMNGTSFSAPLVSGVAAMMKEANRNLSAEQIYDILRRTAHPLVDNKYATSPNMAYGYGMVDAYLAISVALGKTTFYKSDDWDKYRTENRLIQEKLNTNEEIHKKQDKKLPDNYLKDKNMPGDEIKNVGSHINNVNNNNNNNNRLFKGTYYK